LRELIDEAPGARHLVGGEPLPAEFREIFSSRLTTGLELQECDRHLAPVAIGDADHRRVENRRVGVQDILDLARVDVLAATDDDVLAAALHTAIAVLVQAAEVAGSVPILLAGFLNQDVLMNQTAESTVEACSRLTTSIAVCSQHFGGRMPTKNGDAAPLLLRAF
jgi:hypothetical protein